MIKYLSTIAAFLLLTGNAWAAVEVDVDSNGDVDVAFGGTNASTAAAARTNLGVVIGTDVLAPDGDGSSLTGVVGTNETYGSGWNADTAAAEKDDIYDYLHQIDADDDASLTDESWFTAALAAFTGNANIVTLGTVATGEWNGTAIGGSYIAISGTTTETNIAADDLILVYDTSASANRAFTRGNFVSGIGAGQAIILDLADDGSNESTDLGEIAVVNDTNSVFSEPTADKLEIDLSNNWPGADLADVATEANAGDSATAFFDAGTIEHEYGGLEADVSAYSGLVGISGGSTTEVDTAAELESFAGLGAFANEYLDDADAATMRTTLGLAIGTDVLAPDGDGSSLTGLFGSLVEDTTPELGGDLAVGSNEIQSTGNIVLQLGDAAGVNKLSIQDSAGVEVWNVTSDGAAGGVATVDPFVYFNQSTATDFWFGAYDTTTDRVELRTAATAGTSVLGYWDANKFDYAGNINISTGHTFQINDTQIALSDLSDGESHAANHIQSGADEIDGDLIDIDYAQSNYTPATTGVATDVNHLAAHLEGIDDALGASGTGTFAGMTDTNITTPAGGHLPIYDGADSWDNKEITGDVTITSGGVTTIGAAKIDEGMMADASVDLASATVTGVLPDGNVANDITVDLATLATTITVTDNESTNESNAILFTAGGDVDGGNIGAESDGDLTYNPSTGVLAVTGLSSDYADSGVAYTETTTDTNEAVSGNGRTYFNNHASTITYTLPAEPETSSGNGKVFCFRNMQANAMTVDPAAGDVFHYNTDGAMAAGEALISTGAIGEFLCVMGMDNAGTDTWVTFGISGTWAQETP